MEWWRRKRLSSALRFRYSFRDSHSSKKCWSGPPVGRVWRFSPAGCGAGVGSELSGGTLRHIQVWIRTQVGRLADVSYASALLGRLMVSCLGIVMVVMLWTERSWTSENFCWDGHDCELSILALIAFLCLVILLAHRCNQSLTVRLAVQRFLSFVDGFGNGIARVSLFIRGASAFLRGAADSASGVCQTPLLI